MISVVIPVFDCEAYLPKCIDSVLNQTYKDIEVILINDYSHDKSGSICDEYAKKYKNVTVIHHKENLGLSISREDGFNESQGDWFFMDNDDVIRCDTFQKMICLSADCDIVWLLAILQKLYKSGKLIMDG